MEKEPAKKEIKIVNKYSGGPSGAVYGLGFVGAMIYFVQNSTTFTEGFIGFLKALVWPALLIYKVFEFFKF